ncbi:TonB-dependent receptor [bacterium]|nr:TonB-dependent receptor [bacterium]
MLRIASVLLLLVLASATQAGSQLTGIVSDWSNGRAIQGALVEVNGDSAATTDRFGRYTTAMIDSPSIVLRFQANGYVTYAAVIVLADADQTEFNIELKPAPKTPWTEVAVQESPRYLMDDVLISTTRATSDYPVTFSNLTREELDRANYAQDIPQLLTTMPNLYAYSDGGAGFGYSYLRMRGFNQNRVGVYLNGIPLNDSESHEVFWIDLPDFAEDTQDLQVQRGVGSSLYGAAALGGSINLVTKTPGMTDKPTLRAEAMYGTWNTRRASLQFESGRVGGRYGFAGRLTRMDSDGYRFGSWVKQWSYYLAASRFTSRHTSRVLFYGGPERTHLAYEGVSRDYLEGNVTGNKDEDRRYNPLSYSGEIDNFFQPHYELHDSWRLKDNLNLENSIYVFRGDGYYDQFREDRDLSEYYYTLPADSLRADVLRRRNIAETDGGWVPRVTWTHRYGQTVFGGEVRLHNARHEGTIQWASQLPAGASPNHHYYDYRVNKRTISGYVHNLFQITPRLKAMADFQLKSLVYEMREDELFDVTLDKDFDTADPRFGLNYRLLEPKKSIPLTQVYANLSWAKREPAFRDLYNAQDYYSSPLVAPNRFVNGIHGGEYIGPTLKMESLRDLEVGCVAQWQRAHLGLNYYWMTLRDAIVTDNGQLDELGNLLSANAEKVVHQGVEMDGAYEISGHLRLSGNLALTDHRFARYSEVDWWTYLPTSRNENRIGQDPLYLGNLQADVNLNKLFGGAGVRFVGKQYTDNTENNTTAIDGYSLVHLDLGYRLSARTADLKQVELRLHVSNLLDAEFETVGYGESYIVGATRAMFGTIAIDF